MYKVLIAEDELFVRLGIKNSVSWENYDMQVVCDVENGKAAWAKFLEYEPDVILTDIRMPESDQCNQALWRYLEGRASREEVKTVLESCHIHLEGKSLAAALCPIEAVYDSIGVPAVSGSICRNLFDLLFNRSYGDCTHYTFFFQEDLFFLVLCGKPDSTAASIRGLSVRTFGTIQEEIQDYLHISVSFLTVLAKDGIQSLREAYQRAVSMLERHYQDGMGCIIPEWETQETERFEKMAQPLRAHTGWICEGFGRGAANQFERLVREFVDKAAVSQEEMTYRLMGISHWIASLFQELLEDEKQQCDRLILQYPYLPQGVSALNVLLESGEQCYCKNFRPFSRQEIGEAIRFINEHLSMSDMSLGYVAEHIGLSEAYFSTLFRQEMQQTFVKYLSRARIECAKALLRQKNLHIFNVAAQTGFSDEAYFSRVFKKTTGISPSEWRTLWNL